VTAVGPEGNVYVTDEFNHRVQVFSPQGAYITRFGEYGTGDGQFHGPMGIAVDFQGYVYVADSTNHRISKWSPGAVPAEAATFGSLKARFASPESGE
jgi:DNA-binding beta-propeller fold protein YncE